MAKRKASAKTLREKAEQALREKDMSKFVKLSEADTLKLIHELQVHQIELELQNEELTHAHFIAQQSAERYTDLYDFSPTGYFTISQDGLIAELNISGANLFGETRSLVQGKRFENFLTVQSKEIFKRFIEDILSSQSKRTCEVEVSYLKNKKKNVYLVGVLDETKEKYFISAADISELKTIQQKLEVALEKADESAKLKASFLQNLRHEIRTPMNAIIGFSDLLAKSSISEEEKKTYYPMITKSAHQLLSIIEDIISISLIETNQDQINKSEVNLTDLLIDLFTIFQPQAKSKQLSLKLEVVPAANPLHISTDRSKLAQIISNLLTNALKFTHEGEIEFGYRITDSSLLFFVTDTGIGIDPSMHEKVFERFRQANSNIERKYGGTGLGLSISKGLVELLGGKIWVESIPNRGSSFYFKIPALISESYAAPPQRKISGAPVILIAEDDELSFRFLSMAIKQELTCEIYRARNGEEAIEMITAKPEINFILMDVNMPIMSGAEAAAKIKQLRPNLFMMAQTGYDLLAEKEKHIFNLFDSFISKPIDEVVLIARIKQVFSE